VLKVEDRLPLLIQKQLNAEIEQRPPLFPWETEVDEYAASEPESGHHKHIRISTTSIEPVGASAPTEQND
jgi:hypothetical protein